VGNRIKAVQIRVVLERKPVIQNPFQDNISKIYVPQNYKTKSVFARGRRKDPILPLFIRDYCLPLKHKKASQVRKNKLMEETQK
jgi:hypothetical protein